MGKMKETLYTGIDVGTTKVATMVARVSPMGAVDVIALGHATSWGMRKGMVVSPEELLQSVQHSVGEAKAMLGRKLPPAYVGVTGSHLVCENTDASMTHPGAKGKVITRKDISRVMESSIAYTPATQRVLHVIPQQYRVDGLREVRNPVGLTGEQLQARSHVIIGDARPMENLIRVVRAADVRVRALVAEHLASAEAVLSNDERETGVVLVDIGGGTSDVAIFKDGAVIHTAAIPVAGYQFSNDISVGLGLPLSLAEEVKVWYGSTYVDGIKTGTTVELPASGSEAPRQIQQLALNNLLRERSIELVHLIMHTVREAGLDRMPSAGIVYTGGSSNLPGLVEVTEEYAGCPARAGSPSANLGLPQELENATFATGVGLLLWGIRNKHHQPISGKVNVSHQVMDRVKGWLSSLSGKRTEEPELDMNAVFNKQPALAASPRHKA
jgi:cell division protein FtsA